jgi:hypothetical protein
LNSVQTELLEKLLEVEPQFSANDWSGRTPERLSRSRQLRERNCRRNHM